MIYKISSEDYILLIRVSRSVDIEDMMYLCRNEEMRMELSNWQIYFDLNAVYTCRTFRGSGTIVYGQCVLFI